MAVLDNVQTLDLGATDLVGQVGVVVFKRKTETKLLAEHRAPGGLMTVLVMDHNPEVQVDKGVLVEVTGEAVTKEKLCRYFHTKLISGREN